MPDVASIRRSGPSRYYEGGRTGQEVLTLAGELELALVELAV